MLSAKDYGLGLFVTQFGGSFKVASHAWFSAEESMMAAIDTGQVTKPNETPIGRICATTFEDSDVSSPRERKRQRKSPDATNSSVELFKWWPWTSESVQIGTSGAQLLACHINLAPLLFMPLSLSEARARLALDRLSSPSAADSCLVGFANHLRSEQQGQD